MAGDSEVPTPLALADGLQGRFHLGLGSSLVPCVLSLDMRLSQLLLYAVADVVGHTLTLVDVLAQGLCILTVTSLTGLIDLGQWADDLVVGVLDAAFAHVGHMAVGARYTALSVDTHAPELVVGVLCLEDRSTRELMDVVRVIHLIVVGFDILDREALVVGEGKVLAVALEVVLSVALSTDERAHILVRLLRDILSTA